MQMLPTGAGKVVNPPHKPGLVRFFLKKIREGEH